MVKTAMPKQRPDLDSIIKDAVNFHGHLGPFLVIGIRMGLIGLRELKTTANNPKLQATTILKHAVPSSCAIDGIQVATQCTVGNGKLKLKNNPDKVSAVFDLKGERQVTVTLKPTKFDELKRSMPKSAHSYKNIQLAREIASQPEKELFTIEKK